MKTMTIQRMTALAVITLSCVFALTVPTHAAYDSDYGWDPHPVWGSVSVYGFNVTPTYATTQHYVSLENLSDRRDINCHYAFQTQVVQQPQFTTRNTGWLKARRMSNGVREPANLGGWNYLSLAGLNPGHYRVTAYTRVAIGKTIVKAESSVSFNHR